MSNFKKRIEQFGMKTEFEGWIEKRRNEPLYGKPGVFSEGDKVIFINPKNLLYKNDTGIVKRVYESREGTFCEVKLKEHNEFMQGQYPWRFARIIRD